MISTSSNMIGQGGVAGVGSLKTRDAGTRRFGTMQDQDDLVLRKIITRLRPFNTKAINIGPETDIATDLEIDSVAVLDLIMEIEDDYGISMPMSRVSEIRTVGHLAQAVKDLSKEKSD